MAHVVRLGSMWRSFVTFIAISGILRICMLSSAADIKIGELGYGRVTNNSLGEYNFLRVDCLQYVFPNFLNKTTVLPSLQPSLRNDCPTDDGIEVDCRFFIQQKWHFLHYLTHGTIHQITVIDSLSSVYLSRTLVSQFVTAISSSESQGSFTVEMLFRPNVTGDSLVSEIFSLTRWSTDDTYFSVRQASTDLHWTCVIER
jgi:hypothetical protein